MVRFNNNKIVFVALLASAPVLYLGFGAEAVRFSEKQFAQYVGRCASDVGFYERHMRWCETAYRVTYHKAPRQARREPVETFARVQPQGGDQVTVYRDRQANTEVEKPDQFVALQTADDVARSSFFGFALGWFPGALNLGTNTIATQQVVQAQAPRPRVVTTYYVKKVVASQ